MKIIKLDNTEFEIKKLPIGEYGAVIKAVKKLPARFQNLNKLDAENIIEALENDEAIDEVLGVIATISNIPLEKVKTYGLSEVVRIVEAVFEVNEYAEVLNILKKAVAHPIVKNQVSQATQTPKN